MAALADIRKFEYQNPTSGKIWSVVLKRNTDETIDLVGYQIGTKAGGFGASTYDQLDTTPAYDNTKVTGVVITARIADVFGLAAREAVYLSQAAIYDAASRAGAGAALSTICV